MWIDAALLCIASFLASSSNAFAIPASESATQSKAATTLVKRKGINCEGSPICAFRASNANILDAINGYIVHINTTQSYETGDWIACVSGICAFLQDVPLAAGPVNGSQIQQLMIILNDHGKSTRQTPSV
jgi:hypothetical protein